MGLVMVDGKSFDVSPLKREIVLAIVEDWDAPRANAGRIDVEYSPSGVVLYNSRLKAGKRKAQLFPGDPVD